MYQEILVGDAVEEGGEDPALRHEPAAEANRPDGEARGALGRWRRRPLAMGGGAEP
jgi:hypothetical protein